MWKESPEDFAWILPANDHAVLLRPISSPGRPNANILGSCRVPTMPQHGLRERESARRAGDANTVRLLGCRQRTRRLPIYSDRARRFWSRLRRRRAAPAVILAYDLAILAV